MSYRTFSGWLGSSLLISPIVGEKKISITNWVELKFPFDKISPFDDLAQSADWLTLMSRPNPLAALNQTMFGLCFSLCDRIGLRR